MKYYCLLLFSLFSLAIGFSVLEHKNEDGVHKNEDGMHKNEDGMHKIDEGMHKNDEGMHKMMDKNPLASSIFQFGVDLYKAIDSGDNANIVFSPLGTQVLYSSLIHGAKENTKTQLVHSLRLDDVQSLVLHDEFNKILSSYHKIEKERTRDLKLSISNIMLANKDHPINEDYLKHLTEKYLVHASNEDFSKGEEIQLRVNNLVKEKTNNLIDGILHEPISPEEFFLLLNVIYFKGEWIHPFKSSNTFDSKFYKNEQDEVPVKMMTEKRIELPYVDDHDLGVKAVKIPYKSNASLVIFLPKSRTGLAAFKNDLTKEKLSSICHKMNKTHIQLTIPKFTIQMESRLNELLSSLGLSDAFTNQADFSGISDKDFHISKSIQKTVFEVNENGTEAAATTLAITAFASIPQPEETFTADHPFFFVLKDETNGLILFMGEVKNPPAIKTTH